MGPDDDICYCFHVSLRKLVNFAQRVRPKYPSQMSDCLGAGSGCGWCIPFLCRIAERHDAPDGLGLSLTPEEYAAARRAYREAGGQRNRFETASPAPPEPGPGPNDPPPASG